MDAPRHWLTRFVYLRALGFLYCVAFLVVCEQWLPLLGSHGLEPAKLYLDEIVPTTSFWKLPTLFRFTATDGAFQLVGWVGLALSLAVLCGVDNAVVMFVLWALYLSLVHVGQDFYGYGWEILLLEAGFLGIFLCPLRTISAFAERRPPQWPVLLMFRWLVFRVMLGAGLIKIRGDACWRDLTCLAYHYETQPNPNPLSWLLHQAPLWFHQLGVAFNHFVELVAPWFLFGSRWPRHLAAGFVVLFQLVLIASGNLSFLNWLTIAITLVCVDDALWERVLPKRLVARFAAIAVAPPPPPSRVLRAVTVLLSLVVLVRSYQPAANMLSPHQRMNGSFDPFHLVNTYGAFGSVGKQRDEVILQGTSDEHPGPSTRWLEYEFPCKPGDVMRRPCLISPYHYRLDWQMWFAALGNYQNEPFIVSLIYKLLHNEPATLSLLAKNPFPKAPPKLIRAERYRYAFTRWGDADDKRGAWWKRERLGPYLPPLAADNPEVLQFLVAHGYVAGETIDAGQ